MRLVNQTRWRSEHLRAFIVRVAREELDPEVRRGFTVRVSYARRKYGGTYVGGHALYHSRAIHLHMPSPNGGIDKADLALTIAHEMAHARGLRHRDMRTPRYSTWVDGWRDFYAWAEALPMECRPAKGLPVSRENQRAGRLAHAERKLAEWERTVKRAQTMRRKWRARVQRLTRAVTLAAKNISPTG